MTITVSVPTWAWVLAGVLLWYMAAGVFLRVVNHHSKNKLNIGDKVTLWLLSPILAVILPIIVVVWTLMWVVSIGLVPSPWSK